MSDFKYRPKIESVSYLKAGDEFLVGDERWLWTGGRICIGGDVAWGESLTNDLIRAKVPVERDIPCPDGYELVRLCEDDRVPVGAKRWVSGINEFTGEYTNSVYAIASIYAVPLRQEPKVYEVVRGVTCPNWVEVGRDFKPGDRVTVRKAE